MIRFAVIGTGWRSEFYARIARALPDKFDMVAWLCRNEEKLERLNRKYGIYTTMSEEEVERLNPDFIVCAVNKASISDVAIYWSKKGIPILSETPAALNLDMIKTMKKEVDNGAKIQVAEQYFLEPTIAGIIDEIDKGTIGEPVSITISAMHDYHAVSVIRKLLKTGLEEVCITGKTFDMKVTNTKTRYETLTDGKIVECKEKHLILEYKSGKVAFYDFMSEQYRSPIRNKYINVRGTRGEIINDMVYYLDGDNLGTVKKIDVKRDFEEIGLGDDEIAVAKLMIRMKEYVESGKEAYPMDEALYDAYIAILMDEACKDSYKTVSGSSLYTC
jgi:predicted dinucleotide-utilizing enzyme